MFCQSQSPRDESPVEGVAAQPGATSSHNSTPGQASDDSSDDGSNDDSKDHGDSAIDNAICKMLHTAPVQADVNGKILHISPGQNLYLSIFALTINSKDAPIIWKKGLWEAEGITLHRSGLVGCELVGDLIKKYQIGLTEQDDVYKLPARDSALLVAADCKNLDIMRVLLRGGASVNVRAGDGTFPLFLAVSDQDRRRDGEYPIDYYLACGADATQTTADGKTALHQAVLVGFMHGVCALTEKDVCVNTQDNDGCTPLHYACIHVSGRLAAQIARVLLDAGAHVTIKNKAGRTPWECALESKKPELIAILLPEVITGELREEGGMTGDIAKTCLDYYDPESNNQRVCEMLVRVSLKSLTSKPDYGPIDDADKVRVPHTPASYCRRIALEPKPGKPLTGADRDTDDDDSEEE